MADPTGDDEELEFPPGFAPEVREILSLASAKDGDAKPAGSTGRGKGGLEFPPGIDLELRHVIELANMEGGGIWCPVTVLVKGVQISGQVAAGRAAQKWYMTSLFEGIMMHVKPAPELAVAPEDVEAASAPIRKMAESVLPQIAEQFQKMPPPKRVDFLSLKNVRIWGSGGGQPTRFEMFRIRLDQIDAFGLGEPADTNQD